MKYHIPLEIPPEVKTLWDQWNIRGVILFSLWLQILLVLVAPARKSARRKILVSLIWLAYLLADAVAVYAIGLISNSQRNQPSNSKPKPEENSNLLAFWAPFLLLHLGGPDTITAFALEDNQLWLRHLLNLISQAGAVIYVFIQSLPNDDLWVPTSLMFVSGIIKYVERTRALYLASLDKFRDSMLKDPDPGPNYAKLMEEYAYKKDAQLPTTINMTPEPDKETKASDIPQKEGPLNDLEVVHHAYRYFQTFKGLVVDLIFSFRERDESRDFFNMRTPKDALRIIEVELNFIYGALYTKVEVVHSVPGYIFRFLAFGSILATLGIFHKTKKHEYRGVDIGITYTLLLGAIALDVIAFIEIIFSDRTFASIKNPDRPKCGLVAAVFSAFLRLKEPWLRTCNCLVVQKHSEHTHHVLATPLAFRRWSGSISAHNLIRYCLRSHSTSIHKFPSLCQIIFGNKPCFLRLVVWLAKKKVWIHSHFCKVSPGVIVKDKSSGCVKAKKEVRKVFRKVFDILTSPIKDIVDSWLYVSLEPFTMELWEFIFKELKKKSEFADTPETARRISGARGEWALTYNDSGRDRSKILKYLSDVSYDESILLWHIATDLCYYTGTEEHEKSMSGESLSEEDKATLAKTLTHKQFSKILSDYMLYLLIFQPTLMSAVAGIGKIRFRDTCAEAEMFFERRGLELDEDKRACEEILSVNTDVEPEKVKGDRSKSVLFSASMLAKELKSMQDKEEDDKWMIMSRVWVELVSYAASHCRASAHAAEVSKGGELITFFWLLMSHFGLGEQFQINEGHARAKLVVGK